MNPQTRRFSAAPAAFTTPLESPGRSDLGPLALIWKTCGIAQRDRAEA